jgi:cytosine/adenosine deaminase-related metal-dependent hydrolase
VRDCSLLIRAGVLVTDPRESPGIIYDGALCTEGDRIVAVGNYRELAAAFRPRRELGGPDMMLVPGLVNAHDHGRVPSVLQLGVPDDVLEVWIVDLLRLPALDTRDATACAALEQLESGITSSSNSFYARSDYRAQLDATAAGYRDAGLRVGLIASTMDRSVVAELLAAVMPQLAPASRNFVRDLLAARKPPEQSEYFATLREFPVRSADQRQWLLAGPVSLHWCSEPLLRQIWRAARERDLPLQTHLLESPYQARTAQARYGQSAVAYMQQLGLLQSQLSCAHCVQLSAADMDLLAGAEVSVVHNAGSNLRLRNGVAPVPQMLARGINVALGLDSQSLSDDADMWQELRLVARLHQAAGQGLSARQLWAMATINGARALGLEELTGTLAPGKKADLLLLDTAAGRAGWPALAAPDAAEQVFERLVLLTDKSAIAAVLVDGELLMQQGRHGRLDKQALTGRLREQLAQQTRDSERAAFGRQVATLKPALRRYIAAASR